MGQRADNREQIYRNKGGDTLGRELTIESKSIGISATTLGTES